VCATRRPKAWFTISATKLCGRPGEAKKNAKNESATARRDNVLGGMRKQHDFCSLPMLCSNHSWWRRQQNRNSAPLFALCGKFNQGWLVGEASQSGSAESGDLARVKTMPLECGILKCNWDWARTQNHFLDRGKESGAFSVSLYSGFVSMATQFSSIMNWNESRTRHLTFHFVRKRRKLREQKENKELRKDLTSQNFTLLWKAALLLYVF
jgi:hypothetical protein